MSPDKVEQFVKFCFQEQEQEVLLADAEFVTLMRSAKTIQNLEELGRVGHILLLRKKRQQELAESKNAIAKLEVFQSDDSFEVPVRRLG